MQQEAIVRSFNLYLTKAVSGLLSIKRFNGSSAGCVRYISTSRPWVHIFKFFFVMSVTQQYLIPWHFLMLVFSLSRSKNRDNRCFLCSFKRQLCSPCLKMTQISLDVSGTAAGLISFVLALLFVRLLTWDLQQALVFFSQWSLRGLTRAGKKRVRENNWVNLISSQLRSRRNPSYSFGSLHCHPRKGSGKQWSSRNCASFKYCAINVRMWGEAARMSRSGL